MSRSSSIAFSLGALAFFFAVSGCASGNNKPADGGPGDSSAAIDAGPVGPCGPIPDGGTLGDKVVCDGTPLEPTVSTDLQIARVRPMVAGQITGYFELFNPTADTLCLGTRKYVVHVATPTGPQIYYLAGNSVPVTAYITLEPRKYTKVPWNASGLTPENGEIVLLSDAFFSSSRYILDFICWGSAMTNSPTSMRSYAIKAGKWTGPCIEPSSGDAGASPVIPAGAALQRKVSTDGASPASYEVVAAANAASTCGGS